MTGSERNQSERRKILKDARRLVVKVGSRLLTGVADTPNRKRIQQLVAELAAVREQGLDVVLVTSGAIAAGMMLTKASQRPRDLAELQALAAVGQSHLMALYESACQEKGFHAAQILLSGDDVKDRRRHLNVRNCIHSLLSQGHLPIINENDTVSVDEICFGDNDRLAALVGTMIRADITLLLTTTDGLFERREGRLTERISLVATLTDDLRQMAEGTDGNPFSVGGMSTKLAAAEIVMDAGESLWIADGRDFSNLQAIFNGDDVGTLFVPGNTHMPAAKRWLAFFADSVGDVYVDAGAAEALLQRGKSLLPSGIVRVVGPFEKGDTVRVLGLDRKPIATGVTNYGSVDLDRVKGLRSDAIADLLGDNSYVEAVHRNNLVLTG